MRRAVDYYRVEAEAQINGGSILCPRCGKSMKITTFLQDLKFNNYLSCKCTDHSLWHIKRRRGLALSIWDHISSREIEYARNAVMGRA